MSYTQTDYSLGPPVSSPQQDQQTNESNFLKSFSNYNSSWENPSIGTTYDSPTPKSTQSASPDIFSSIFSGLSQGLGQALPAFLNTSATNLANRITAGPTVKAVGPATTAQVSSTKILGLTPLTWVAIVIGGGIIAFIVFKK